MTSEQVLVGRLQRIDQCLDRIQGEIKTFLHTEPKPYVTEVYFDTKASEYVYRARVVRPAEPSLSVAIGEFLHNTRSALDNVAWQLARPEPPTGTCFPIFKTPTEYRRLWTRNSGYYATRAMPLEAQAIIEDAQPYHRGNGAEGHPLWVLNRLANVDKHETLHLAGSAVTDTKFAIVKQDGVTIAPPKFFRGPFKDGAVVARQSVPQAVIPGVGEMHVNVRIAYEVAFEKDSPARGASVERALQDIRNFALGTIVRLLPLVPPFPVEPPFERPAHEVPAEQGPPI